jgi:nitric oxide reductase NorD protein
MEEQVGLLWHKMVTRAADTRFPEAAVNLHDMHRTLGVFFRALGGDGGLEVQAAEAFEHGARRGFFKRLAGSGKKTELAWRDDRALRLPQCIECFSSAALNRDLYLWLAALAAMETAETPAWFAKNQQLSLLALNRFPGLASRYRKLLDAHLLLRPDPDKLAPDEALQEQQIRAALTHPGSLQRLSPARRPPFPVSLWLHPNPPTSIAAPAGSSDAEAGGGAVKTPEDERRRKAERVDAPPEEDRGLITIRMENIFTWGEFSKLDRSSDEEDDPDTAAQALDDMDNLSMARDGKSIASKLKFDLDLPSSDCDDSITGEGILLPEWDHKRARLLKDHCRILPMEARDAEPGPLPMHLKPAAKRLRAQFQQLMPARVWLSGQPDGSEIDLDAFLRFSTDRASGQIAGGDGLYRDLRAGARDLSCLLLADLSLSTDTYVDDDNRVIDVIRDSLYLFAESLAATGDRFSLYGFSSRKRDPVRFHRIKGFDQRYDPAVRGRIAAIKAGYYTRMGAAIRYARKLLEPEPSERRLLLLISDGKPNDLDKYEGRYGIEDTRHAVREAKEAGLQPFCVTVDEKGNDYLPYLFGSGGYLVIKRPQELPNKLPLLYARLTR